jgi:chemosensory pili system protein ChpC
VTQTEEKVRSQLIPLNGLPLVVPTTCIAEVVSYQEPDPLEDAPEWLLGLANWRGIQIPLVSFEAGNELPKGELQRRARIIVLNGISGDDELAFFGIVSQDIPRLMLLDANSVSAQAEPPADYPLALEYTLVNGQEALIPDLKQLESMIKDRGIKVMAETV